MAKSIEIGAIVCIGNENYRILAVGVRRDDGAVYAHLASTTRFFTQRNGKVPVQIADFFMPIELGVSA